MSVLGNNSLGDWDIITVADLTRAAQIAANQTTSVTNNFFHKVEKIVSKAFSRSSTSSPISESSLSSLSDKQYYSYLDSEGRIRSARDLRSSIFRRGVDPVLRRAVWKHLLNVYPDGLTGNQRYEYIKEKTDQYNLMKSFWVSLIGSNEMVDCTLNMVRKDVLRTDRMHPFYSGSSASEDDNPNVKSLLNILTTFALNHGVKYCQGMSDLASPLLYAMKDEAQAYICFCGLMLRLRENFTLDGEAISCKFNNLSRLLQYYDGDFYSYLKQVGAQDLLFCYRWILLELKREFPFDCALTMLEVLWSSIPSVVIDDLPLFDRGFRFTTDSLQGALAIDNDLSPIHTGSSDENDADVDDDEEPEGYIKSKSNSKSLEDQVNANNNPSICDTNTNNKNNISLQTSGRKQVTSTNGSRNVKIPVVNRRRNGNHLTGNQFSLMNHSLPEYGARFECGDLENSGSIRIKGLYLSHMNHQMSIMSNSSPNHSNQLSSSPISIDRSSRNNLHNLNSTASSRINGLPTQSTPGSGTPQSNNNASHNSLPHLMKSSRPLRTIRFLPKILSNDSREIDSPDEETPTKTFNFPPKFIDKGFSIDSDGDCRRLNSFESVGSSKNSSIDMEEEADPSANNHHSDLRNGIAGLAGIKGGENNTSTSSSSSSSSAAVRLRCQQRRRLFCRLGSSGGSTGTGNGLNRSGSFGRENSEPGSPSSFHSGSFNYNVSNTHEVETDHEQDLIVHCNGEYTDSRVNQQQQDWIIPRGLARSVSYECIKNLTITPGSPTRDCNGSPNGTHLITNGTGHNGNLSTLGTRGSTSNNGSGLHLNSTGLTPTSETGELVGGALLGSRNSSTQGLEKERSEGYGSGSDPSDLMSEVHSAFGGTIDGNKSDSSSCSSLVILNSNGSSTTESNRSPSSSSPSSLLPPSTHSIEENTSNNNEDNDLAGQQNNNRTNTNNNNSNNINGNNLVEEKPILPSPEELGSSNAFMLFLCLTILLQHRDKIISSGFDCNEIAVYFDSFIRRHNVQSVLETSRSLYNSYLSQWQQNTDSETDPSQPFPPAN